MSCESRISGPYDLPSPPLATKSQGWLSKFVGGATRIFSSVYSLCFDDENDHSGNTDHYMEATDDERCDPSEDVIVSSKETHPNEVSESLKRFSEPGEVGKGKQIIEVGKGKQIISYQSEISRSKQLIKGKKMSRDKINHFIESLNSETSDSHEAERGTREIVTTAAVVTEIPLWTRQGRREDYNRAIPETPLPQLKVGDKIGASPIDLAKSFMKSRKLEPCATPYSVSIKAEERLQLIESATKPLMPSPSRASAMCSPHWPGIMVANQRGYVSPLTHKGLHGIHDFPRTPYSRTIYSNSKARKLNLPPSVSEAP